MWVSGWWPFVMLKFVREKNGLLKKMLYSLNTLLHKRYLTLNISDTRIFQDNHILKNDGNALAPSSKLWLQKFVQYVHVFMGLTHGLCYMEGTKPSPEPKMTYHYICPVAFTWGQFCWKLISIIIMCLKVAQITGKTPKEPMNYSGVDVKHSSISKICIQFYCALPHCGYYHLLCMMTSSNEYIFCVTGHLCGEFTGPSEFPTQRPVARSFDVFFDLRLNKRLSKQSLGWWFETLSCPLWRHYNGWGSNHGVYGLNWYQTMTKHNKEGTICTLIGIWYNTFVKVTPLIDFKRVQKALQMA